MYLNSHSYLIEYDYTYQYISDLDWRYDNDITFEDNTVIYFIKISHLTILIFDIKLVILINIIIKYWIIDICGGNVRRYVTL